MPTNAHKNADQQLPMVKDPVAIELMRTLKAALDPNGILNPGKVL